MSTLTKTYTRSPKRSIHPQIPPTRQNFDWVTIIGLVEDFHSQGLERGPMAQIFGAQSQSLQGAPPALQSRWSPSPSPYLANVRATIRPEHVSQTGKHYAVRED